MEIPNLISKITGSQTENLEYFLALEVNNYCVKAAIWSVINNKIQVLATGTPAMWAGKDPDDLATAADTTLSVAVQSFKGPAGKEPKKVVFGLPEMWVTNDKIKPEFQPFLRELSRSLALEPIGFVVTIEAIIHHLKAEEGVPPSLILVGINELNIEVTLSQIGRIVGTQAVARSVSLGDDLEEGLSRFNVSDMLPSRILLFDAASDLEDAKQRLLEHPWMDKLPFLHLPKIEPLPVDFSIRSVALSGGTEFAKSRGIVEEDRANTSYQTQVVEVEPEQPNETVVNSKENDDLGFITGQDITAVDNSPSVTPSSLTETEPARVGLRTKPEGFKFPRISLSSLFQFKTKIRLPRFSKSPPIFGPTPVKRLKLPYILLGLSLALITGIFLSFWFLPKATIIIAFEPKSLDKEFIVTLDSGLKSADYENKIIPAKALETETSGEKTIPTTGRKTVGDKAKGEVTIYNATPQTKILSAGTTLQSPAGLKFTLDTQVSIASKSGTADSSVPGVATAKTTSVNIGEEYNLSAGTEFKLASFAVSDVVAKNTLAFSGGSSRQIQSVAKDDLATAKSALTDELTAKARDDLAQKLEPGSSLVESSIATDTLSREFDKNAGDEGTILSLTLKLKATALSYNSHDLDEIAAKEIVTALPEGYEFKKDSNSFKLEPKPSDQNKSIFTVSSSSLLLPKISGDEIKNSLTGKSLGKAREILKQLPGFISANMELKPNFIQILPQVARNIEIVTTSN